MSKFLEVKSSCDIIPKILLGDVCRNFVITVSWKPLHDEGNLGMKVSSRQNMEWGPVGSVRLRWDA